jgi:hypothetical protein
MELGCRYGVSKVYSQQCGYALLEAQSVKDRMYTMLKTLQNAGLDPEAGKARWVTLFRGCANCC